MSRELYTADGRRKYLTASERAAFIRAAYREPRHTRTFGLVMVHTGCRLSEALALMADRVDMENGALVFETLKKRRRGIYRAVPVPPDLIEALDLAHGLRDGYVGRLWPWSRATGWRRIKAIMASAGIDGPQASPKGLRHGYAIHALHSHAPLNLVQRWLGHAQLSTTAIYADATGDEERAIAARMWSAAS